VFRSISRLFVCLRMRMSTSKQYANVYVEKFSYVREPLRECRSIWSGASGLPYYCAPLVCVSEVIKLLAVWRYYKPKTTGLNVLAKNRRNKHVNLIDAGLKVAKTRFQRFFWGKSVFNLIRNVRFKSFMHMEWSEEKFLKGIVGDKTRLHLWNKHQKIQLVFTQLVHYNWIHARALKYQTTIPENLNYK